jgi:hypothetical protein
MKRKKTKPEPEVASEMRLVDCAGAQGDVLFRKVDAVPADYKPQRPSDQIIVAHSETGHHHTVSGANVTLFAKAGDLMTSYLQMKCEGVVPVIHHRPFDTHKPMGLRGESGTVWEIRRQREHTPEGWRQVAD